MRFQPSFLDEIKARLPVSEVVRRRVKLLKAGREWKGLSPFSAEKTPSFFVNDQKQAWFDFSSGQNGNIFDFLMKTEGLSFPEAVERLAGQAGLALPVMSEESVAREKKRASLHEVMNLAADFFEAQLQARGGARARGYLADRDLGANLQRQFRIGYAPDDRFALRDYLAGRDVTSEAMIEAGLLVHGEDIAVPYDRFRNRVMFPICDRSGRVIAFGGRALDKDAPAKYLNSPETPLFHKGAVLYNHHNARKAAHDSGSVIAVEGYVDAISMTAAGFAHVVAPLGTALTIDQCQLLWQMAEEPILCFDGDRAGRKAAARAIDLALPLIGAGRSLRFAFLPEGQDPDDLARSGGHEAIAAVLAAAKPLVEVLFQRELEAGPVDTPERRAALDRRIHEALRLISDETLRRYYREDIAGRMAALGGGAGGYGARRAGTGSGGARFGAGQGSWLDRSRANGRFQGSGAGGRGAFAPPGGYRFQPVSASPGLTRTAIFAPNGVISPREAQILMVLTNHPGLLHMYAEDLADLSCIHADAARLREGLLACIHTLHDDHEALKQALRDCGAGEALDRVFAAGAGANVWSLKPEAAIEDAEATLKQDLALHRRVRALHKELKSAEIALAQDGGEANLARLQEIQSEIASLEGREAAIDGFGVMSGRPARIL